MNMQEIQNRIQSLEKELDELKDLSSKPNVSLEEVFLQLVDIYNISIKIDKEKYPDSVFFFNGEKFLAEYDKKYPKNIWINWDIWGVFMDEYGMKYLEIQKFMRNQIREHFKWQVSEPSTAGILRAHVIREHFKLKINESHEAVWSASKAIYDHCKREE